MHPDKAIAEYDAATAETDRIRRQTATTDRMPSLDMQIETARSERARKRREYLRETAAFWSYTLTIFAAGTVFGWICSLLNR